MPTRFPRTLRPLLGGALGLLVASSLSAQRPAAREARAPARAAAAATNGADTAQAASMGRVSTTHHTIVLDGKTIAYTANAGTMVLRDSLGKPAATVFYIAYTRDGENPETRPVTFFYNGGPGSSSIWLDMGIMSPRHPDMGPAGTQPAPPYDLVDNPYSPLDGTDLVQVDAMMTGYSRPAPGVKASEFTGDVNDAKMFGEFIRGYLDTYHRWQSPKFLFGESYGTFRSAGLVSDLQDREGIELNGIMLLGTVLDLEYIAPTPTNDIAYACFLPTYTATAWYHKKLPPDLQSLTLQQVVQRARDYAFGDYLTALAKGNTLTEAQRTAVAQTLAQLTGVSQQFIMNTNLRIDPGMYRTELLRDEHLIIGRYDSRLTAVPGNAASQRQDFDPSGQAPSGAFMSAFMRYLQNDLKYTSDLQYYMGGHTGPWKWNNGGWRGYPSTVESLQLAMSKNPYLHVFVGAGYYDMATPFANAEFTFHHLGFDPTYTDRVSFDYFESGHMAYLNQASAKQLRADIERFIASNSHPSAPAQVTMGH